MPKINIFSLFAAICTLVLIGYLWLIYLPMFEGSNAYAGIKNVVIIVTIALSIVVILHTIMATRLLPPTK